MLTCENLCQVRPNEITVTSVTQSTSMPCAQNTITTALNTTRDILKTLECRYLLLFLHVVGLSSRSLCTCSRPLSDLFLLYSPSVHIKIPLCAQTVSVQLTAKSPAFFTQADYSSYAPVSGQSGLWIKIPLQSNMFANTQYSFSFVVTNPAATQVAICYCGLGLSMCLCLCACVRVVCVLNRQRAKNATVNLSS